MIDTSKPPDFVNELGTKFWLDEILTDHAAKPDVHGRKLPGMRVYYVETTENKRLYLMVNKDGLPVEEANGVEHMACLIDVRKFLIAEDAPDWKKRKPKPKEK